jgi:hypothetical protein
VTRSSSKADKCAAVDQNTAPPRVIYDRAKSLAISPITANDAGCRFSIVQAIVGLLSMIMVSVERG